jgi:DNA polymerase
MTMLMNDLDLRRSALGDLNAQIHSCHACPLGSTRTKAVPGEGPVDAEVMLIGEAPGYYEDQQGRPFIGAAGQFLETLLTSIGLKRTDVFIANVIKCRPPGNRDPLPDEISACAGYLESQKKTIKPKVVVTLGRYSLAKFFPGQPISKIHGQGRKVGDTWVVPMYHPAAALHQGSLRRTIEEDFKKIPMYVQKARDEEAAAAAAALAVQEPVIVAAPQATQGKLF